jgi:hypothetical protein
VALAIYGVFGHIVVMAKKIAKKVGKKATSTWVVVAYIMVPKKQVVTHFVVADNERQAMGMVQELYSGETVRMVVGKLTANGAGTVNLKKKDGLTDAEQLDIW